MEIQKLTEKLGQEGLDAEKLGRDFFDGAYNEKDTRLFLTELLRPENMRIICPVICAEYFSNSLLKLDYKNFTGLSSLDSRYFDIFLSLCNYGALTLTDIFPYLIFILSSGENSRTARWKEAVASYLYTQTARDFNEIFELFMRFDTSYAHFDILMRADYGETVATLCEMFLNGKVADKAALMRFFFRERPDISGFLMKRYEGAELKHKRAIVRLLLIYKNDGTVTEFLQALLHNDPSKLVRAMIQRDISDKNLRRNKAGKKPPVFNLTDAMLSGETLSYPEFCEKVLGVRKNARIADTLFFTVWDGDEIKDIAIVDKNVLCNLDNAPIELAEGAGIGVLHPCDIKPQFEFIKRLNIDQKINQLNRRIFKPDYAERNGFSMRFSGRTVTLDALLKKARKYKFFFINKEHATDYRYPAAFLNGYALVLEMVNTDSDNTLMPVSAGRAVFYRSGDLIRIHSKCYTKNVPFCPVDEIPVRVFSELALRADMLLSAR